jgi:hypothetical protein
MTYIAGFPKRLCAAAIISFLLGACAPLPPIDVSQSASLVRTSISDSKKSVVSSIEVKNDAPPPVPAENTTFSASYMPIGSNTAETVAADIKAYFDGATTRGTEDAQVIARIEIADAYWVLKAAAKVPIVGIFLLAETASSL